MRKTNIRVDNVFIIEENGKHFLSDVDQVETWMELPEGELEKKGKDITEKISSLLDVHDISSNVNFIGFEAFDLKGAGS